VANTGFKQHIKSKTHKDFVSNYKKYYAEVDQAKEIIKELRIENEFLTRKNIKLQQKVDELENEEFHDF
jgi:intergrase/recombinase